MKKKLLARTMLGAAVMLLAASFAHADEKVVAKVPFEFMVGQLRLPAGEYVVSQLDNPALVSIASEDRRHFAFALTNSIAPEDAGSNPELVFQRVGDHYFLQRIIATGNQGREIPLAPKLLKQAAERVAVALKPVSTIASTR
jgi:hypothetical protein